MQFHLPIAVCLFEKNGVPSDGTSRRSRLDLGFHQVRPDVPKSIANYAKSGDNKNATLVHHVVFFTSMTYAECQGVVREKIAAISGGWMVGKTKEIVGDKDRIAQAMTAIALDCSFLKEVQKQRIERNYPRHAGPKYGGGHDRDPRESQGSEDLDDTDGEEEEEEEGDEDDDDFIDDEDV